MPASWPALRDLPLGAKFGVACLVLVLIGGLIASGTHVLWHYQNRDERPGLTLDDFTGAYSGVERIAPLIVALERGHPPELPEADRETLLAWLRGDRVSEDFDSLDLGDDAPAEIIAAHCLRCHARQASEGDGIGRTIPLEFWSDVQRVAFSRQIQRTPAGVLVASTHAHALSLATMAFVVGALALMTTWPRRLVAWGVGLMGLALLADMGGWWLARLSPAFVPMIVAAGSAYSGLTGLLLLGVLGELLKPPRPTQAGR